MSKEAPGHERGFSLIELLVAMVVTLLVVGAMYGLLTGGKTSFRTQPELTQRQQNVRMAMDLLQHDTAQAGMGFGNFPQAFTDNLDAVGPLTAYGRNADNLEISGMEGSCPQVPVDAANPVDGDNVNAALEFPACYPEPGMLYIIYPTGTKLGWGFNIHALDRKVNFPPGKQPPGIKPKPLDEFPVGTPMNPVAIGPFTGGRITYAIAPDANGIPALWRSATGGFDNVGGVFVPVPNPAAWQLVATGIEDLQVQYLNGNGAWADTPGAVVNGAWATIVRQVRVTVFSRAIGTNLQGESRPTPGAVQAVRGQLTSIVTPRAALFALSQAPVNDPQRWQ